MSYFHNQKSISVETSISRRNKPWLFKIDDTIEVRERCIRPSVRTAKRNAKSLLNPGKIVPCIARTVFPSTKIAVVKKMFLGREYV